MITEFRGRRNENGGTEVFVVYDDRPPQPLINCALKESPDGFDWGYGAVGPYALAKSILHEIDPQYAKMHWLVDTFMWNFIAPINTDYIKRFTAGADKWTLTIEKIEIFIARKTANIN